MRSVFCGVLVSAFATLCCLLDASAATFNGLGTLPNGDSSFAYGASADASVVVGESLVDGLFLPFRWNKQTGMVALTPYYHSDFYENSAFGVSADGNVVVGTTYDAFIWRTNTEIQLLPINDGGYANARAVSADGSVIGGEWEPDQRNGSEVFAAYWTNGSGPYAVSATQSSGTDQVTGVSDSGLNLTGTIGHFAFWRADDGTLYSITNDALNVIITRGLGMSRNGKFVVGEDATEDGDGNFTNGMFRWSLSNGLQLLGHAVGDSFAKALAISNDGNTAVGADRPDQFTTNSIALIWRPQWGVRHLQEVLTNDYGLDLSGWHLLGGRGISVDGTVIVGNAVNPSGRVEAFIATIDSASPHISIQCDGANCVLSWPTNAGAFLLQQCSDGTMTNWTAISNTPSVIGRQYVVTNVVSVSATYFRIQKQ